MQISFLQPVYGFSAPVASVYVNVSRDSEDADHAIRVRWGKIREELLDQGVDEASVAELAGVVGRDEGEPGPCGQVAFAAEGRVLWDTLVADPPQDYDVGVGALPNPMPYLRRRGQHVPYVLAVVDTTGADVHAVDARGVRHGRVVEGEDDLTHKPRGGAEHHKQMQRAVDERVKHNAKRIAEAMEELAVQGETERVVLAGETQVRTEIHDQLPTWVRERATEIESGSRAKSAHDSYLEPELRTVLRERADQQIRSVVERYQEGLGNEDRVAVGPRATVSALQRGQVETLLVDPDAFEGDSWLWIGPSPEQLAVTERELRDMGVAEPTAERAEAALLRAAVMTSAELVLVPQDRADLQDGVGALLRFDDPTMRT
ncbi:baeRF2 domain-containing protein [Halostreptopolyspora alba]|uniref:Peptide chain release factor 1 n=1 Tax=Halostreptopolyspora alba TaxID=2487137 RepID=A0A3N0EG18_9ACTN|nr:hypothetical protein EFW17_02655 [Nocardiopsaceae bacterium YIM 96095]